MNKWKFGIRLNLTFVHRDESFIEPGREVIGPILWHSQGLCCIVPRAVVDNFHIRAESDVHGRALISWGQGIPISAKAARVLLPSESGDDLRESCSATETDGEDESYEPQPDPVRFVTDSDKNL